MKKIIFWGTPEFSLPSLESLVKLDLVKAVVTQSDKPAGRGQKLNISAIKKYALEHDLFVLQSDSLDEAFVNELKQFLPATFVTVAYGKIIPQEILDLSELPALNIHPSKLPILRGPSPIQMALLEGFESTAVSLMQLDAKMDHGPILGQIELKIEAEYDYVSLSTKLSEIGGQLLTQNISPYLSGQLSGVVQDDAEATFCKLIKKEAGLINWQNSAENILNQVRAFIVWPKSFTSLKNIEVKIEKVKISELKLNPGEIKIEKDKLFIGTQTFALEILQLQPANKKSMSSGDFIRGYQNKL
jgi:methionyl-tRNA formyltransferase